jgi:O-antigen ligase
MSTAQAALSSAHSDGSLLAERLELGAVVTLFGVAAFTQLSIAIAQSLLTIAIACWVALITVRHERIEVPRFFWPLVAYAGATLVSSAFSVHPRVSFVDSKQLVLFLIVPLAYRLMGGGRGLTMLTVIVSAGALSAALGIFQYGLLHYNQLSQRPQGTLGHYMTYSGLLMLVIGVATARLLFARRDRLWSALVMPALAIAIALTLSRNAWVGVTTAVALLIAMKDFRLLVVLPVIALVVFAFAPVTVTARFASMFDLKDDTTRDRVAMLREGQHMVRDHPLVGVGPDMVKERYAEYRDPLAVKPVNPHLHNVPVQIAAERGLPALAAWLAFIAVLGAGLIREFNRGEHRVLAAAALAAVAATLTAGLFEYNFGDSEFLMLFLIVATLPFAASRPLDPTRPA